MYILFKQINKLKMKKNLNCVKKPINLGPKVILESFPQLNCFPKKKSRIT